MKRLLLLTAFALIFHSCGLTEAEIKENRTKDSLAKIEIARGNAEIEAQNKAQREEKRIFDSLELANHRNAVKNSIKITTCYLSNPNSAGGVDAHFRYTNLNEKTIKYLTWEGYPINDVGDAVSCTIRNYSSFKGQDTGPVKKGKSSGSGYWDCAWYNYQASKLILTGVYIEYMDGSTFNITAEDDLYIIGKKRN